MTVSLAKMRNNSRSSEPGGNVLGGGFVAAVNYVRDHPDELAGTILTMEWQVAAIPCLFEVLAEGSEGGAETPPPRRRCTALRRR